MGLAPPSSYWWAKAHPTSLAKVLCLESAIFLQNVYTILACSYVYNSRERSSPKAEGAAETRCTIRTNVLTVV